MYRNAKEKAKNAKKMAIEAYLEMSNIKKTYMLESDSDEDDTDFINSDSDEDDNNEDDNNE